MSEISQSSSVISDGSCSVAYGEFKDVSSRRKEDLIMKVPNTPKQRQSCCGILWDMRRAVIFVNVLTISLIVITFAILVLLEVRRSLDLIVTLLTIPTIRCLEYDR